jgi:putative inorganic carbon (hco3(-)) transporter
MKLKNVLLIVEPIVIAGILYLYWLPNASRIFSITLIIPLLVLRLLIYRKYLFAHTPLNWGLLGIVALGIVNKFVAPFSFGSAEVIFEPLGLDMTIEWAWLFWSRLLMGGAVVLVVVEHARLRRSMTGIVTVGILMGLLVAGMALGATQWNEKSTPLRPLIDLLPIVRTIPGAEGGFNANEIAGALAWLTPLMAGFALYRWPNRGLQLGAAVAFILLLLALYLGQSRFALAGVLLALAVIIFLLIPHGRKRWLALAALGLLIAAEIPIYVYQSTALEERDEESVSARAEIWSAGLAMLRDHPLTGVGMNLYRSRQVRAVYPVTGYEDRVLPHAHNELIQVSADLGLPGLSLFIGLYAVTAWMLWRIWVRGDSQGRVVAVAVGCGLLAHAVFGVGDAVALWDRFIFLFWIMLGIAAAQYFISSSHESHNDRSLKN